MAINFPAAFLAGLVSFASPCVLPLVPGYIAYFSGLSLEELKAGTGRRRVFVATLLFVAGFTVIFVALGATSTLIGSFLSDHLDLFTRLAGILIILFGLAFLGLLPVPWLYSERRLHVTAGVGLQKNFLMGMAFGFGWTPCIGPALGAVITLAAVEPTPGRGALLLAIYSLGLGIPFILVGVGLSKLTGTLTWVRSHQLAITRVSGIFLIAAGLLFFSGKLFVVSSFLRKNFGLGVGL